MGNVVNREKYNYNTSTVDTGNGKRKAVDNGDALSDALRALDRKGISEVLRLNGLGDRVEKHAHLNNGMFRMISGQSLRALLKKGTPIKLNKKEVLEAL